MDRTKFKSLNDTDRINWVTEMYDQGYKTMDIIKEFNIPKNTLGDTMRRNGYKSNNGIYEKFEKGLKKVANEEVKPKEVITQTQIFKPKKVINELQNFEGMRELQEMFTWYNEQRSKVEEQEEINAWVRTQIKNHGIIDVPEIFIDKNKLTGNIKTRSFNIPVDVLDKFDKFANKKPFKKQEMVAMALVEYMEKYK